MNASRLASLIGSVCGKYGGCSRGFFRIDSVSGVPEGTSENSQCGASKTGGMKSVAGIMNWSNIVASFWWRGE